MTQKNHTKRKQYNIAPNRSKDTSTNTSIKSDNAIVIPKKNLASFAWGMVFMVLLICALGGAFAIFYAGNQRIAQVATPTASTDAATKGYVDAAMFGANLTVFNASGTWTRPSGVNKVWVTMVAGGGGGGASVTGLGTGGGGGGGGGQSFVRYPVAVSGDVTVTIGPGGTAGAAPSGNGGMGGNTSFGALNVTGGYGGAGAASGFMTGAGGMGGGRTVAGTYAGGDGMGSGGGGGGNAASNGGNCGPYGGGTGSLGGGGGASTFGAGGAAGASAAGSAGIGYGSGGGGAGTNGGFQFNGGAGAPGYLIVEW